jgi:glycosyltransferase involved in cell wall biosynthesis
MPDALRWPPRPVDRQVVLHTRVVSGAGGGPDKTIRLSAAYLAETRYWMAAAYLYPPGDPGFQVLRARAAAAACPLVGIWDRGPLDPTVALQLLRLCRHLDVRIWHAHDYKSNLLGLLLRPFHPMKLVSTAHGWVTLSRRARLYYALERSCLPHYDAVISVSDDLAQQVRALGVPEERSYLIFNGIDERAFQRRYPAASSPLRERCAVPANCLVVGAVGRLSPEKGYEILVDAAATLRSRGVDFEVWIAGQGALRERLQRQVQRRGLQDRVKLLGFLEDPAELFQALDLFVLSSLREGFPNVLLEAMASEVPVVATAVGGVPRLVADDLTGLLCPVGDADALATSIERALADPALRARLAQAGRSLVVERYRLSQSMARTRALYDRLLGIRVADSTFPTSDDPEAGLRATTSR